MSNLHKILNSTSLSNLMLAMEPDDEVTLNRDHAYDGVNVTVVRHIKGRDIEATRLVLRQEIEEMRWEHAVLSSIKQMVVEIENGGGR